MCMSNVSIPIINKWMASFLQVFGVFIPPVFRSTWITMTDMGVSKNRGTPKWMVYNGKPYQNGFGGTIIFGNIHIAPERQFLILWQYHPLLPDQLFEKAAYFVGRTWLSTGFYAKCFRVLLDTFVDCTLTWIWGRHWVNQNISPWNSSWWFPYFSSLYRAIPTLWKVVKSSGTATKNPSHLRDPLNMD